MKINLPLSLPAFLRIGWRGQPADQNGRGCHNGIGARLVLRHCTDSVRQVAGRHRLTASATQRRHFRQALCLVSFVILNAAWESVGAASSDQYNRNWPQWRGPAGNGLVRNGNPPLNWNEDQNVKWKVTLPGLGHATPIIWENKIFILTAVPATESGPAVSFTVLCLDRRTGQTLWQKIARTDSPHQDIQPTNSHSSGSPVTDGEHLIVSFGSYGLCVEAT